MAIDEKTRLDLRSWFETQMDDPDLASAVMEAMPPLDYDQFATKTDLGNLRTELRGDMLELRTELKSDMHELRTEFKSDMHELRTEFKSDMHELRTEFKSDMHELRTEVKSDIHELRTEVKSDIGRLETQMAANHVSALKWTFGMQFTSVAVLGGLFAYLV